jgi:hypothetical protein
LPLALAAIVVVPLIAHGSSIAVDDANDTAVRALRPWALHAQFRTCCFPEALSSAI